MSPFFQVLIVGFGTYLFRLSAIALLGGGRNIPERLDETLRLIAPAVLAGLVANSLILDHGSLRDIGAWHVAALVAVAVSVWKKSLGLTLAAGMIGLWLLSAVS